MIDPGKLVAGLPEDISVILANLQAIAATINGSLDNSNLVNGAAIAPSKIAGYPADASKALLGDGSWGSPAVGVGGAIPTGALFPFAAPVAPGGYLLCDGSAVARGTYPALYALLGVTYGSGDGSTTFNVPDMRGRAAVGLGTNADVAALGANDGVAVGSRRPKHNHTNGLSASHNLSLPDHTHGPGNLNVVALILRDYGASYQAGPYFHSNENLPIGGNTGGINTAPGINGGVSVGGTIGVAGPTDAEAYLVVNYIIKT